MDAENAAPGARRRPGRVARGLALAAVFVLGGAGVILARTATRPLDVSLTSSIEIAKQVRGRWEVIDRVGPAKVSFSASLLDLARGQKFESAYMLDTKTKKGLRYTARLAQPASIQFSPRSGDVEVDLVFEVTYGDQKARVPGRLTTQSISSPLGGSLRGSPATAGAILGSKPTRATLVSANSFRPSGSKQSLMLICTETYALTPTS